MPPSKRMLAVGGNVTSPKLVVDFINVGQGNAVLVSYPNGNFMLVDCGSQETSLSGRAYAHAQSYITSVTGGTSITCVVMSHGDDDHTAFVPYIAEAQNPSDVYHGGKPSDYSADVRQWMSTVTPICRRNGGSVWRFNDGYVNTEPDADFGSETTPGEAHVSVLCANYGDSTNSRSVVLSIKLGDVGIILPGDADSSTEAFIMSRVASKFLRDCVVLMAGHHGSAESTSDAWAQRLLPEAPVISASGTNMSYAHPACRVTSTLMRHSYNEAAQHAVLCSDGRGKPYESSQTKEALFVTATQGDVRFETNGSAYRVLASSYGATVPVDVAPFPELVANSPWRRAELASHAVLHNDSGPPRAVGWPPVLPDDDMRAAERVPG